jgi:hypothetical protein
MISSDKREFLELLNAVFEMYGKPQPSVQAVAMYFNVLSHISIDDFKSAMNVHSRDTDSGQFVPKPADILRCLQGSKGTQAEVAWSKLDKAVRTVGPHASVVFDDRLIHAVVEDMGGWIKLGSTGSDEYPFIHNQFVKRYTGYVNNPPDRVLPKLIGESEHYNSTEGQAHHVAPPRLIGDAQGALLVLKSENGTGRVGVTHIGKDFLLSLAIPEQKQLGNTELGL